MAQQNNQPTNTLEVKSPYNFVPAPKEGEVFIPTWADRVSHDIPFSDGESGEIDITITAETPIFIRNGHIKDFEENEFSHFGEGDNKRYFIPATSLKGMLRNVLEILSLSRMRQFENNKHSIRQIIKVDGVVIDEGYELAGKKSDINCGYLIENNGKYFIYNCDKPFKIRFTDLDTKFENKFTKTFGEKVSANFNERTGAHKYQNIIGDKKLEYKFERHTLDEDDKQKSWVSQFQKLPYVKFSELNTNESFKGRIVCVGQASPYNVSTARKGEYVFKGSREEVIKNEKVKIQIDKDVIETFLFLNRHNKKESEELKDWTFWKDKLNFGVPVFFRKDDKGKVVDLGMTYMYKQPVKHSVAELLPYKDGLDLAECIFGTTQKGLELKGRVFISNCLAESKINPLPIQNNVLSSPKSSYIPFYLKQNDTLKNLSEFNTYNTGGTLRGFKKYPVHDKFKIQKIDETKPNLISKSSPLPSGTIFKGKIRFHNLKPIELGALLSSLTLHGTNAHTFFNIGGLKPFGYGRIKVDIASKLDERFFMKTFETQMKLTNQNLWEQKMKELISMSTISQNESNLEYMKLEDFQKLKEKGGYLNKYSDISQSKNLMNHFSSESDIQILRKQILQIETESENRKVELLKNAQDNINNDKFEESKLFFKEYNKLVTEFDLESKLIEIDNLKDLFAIFQTIILSNAIEDLEIGKTKFNNTKWYTLLENRISELRQNSKKNQAQAQANEELVFGSLSFESIKSICSQYLKNKQFVFSEIQKNQIFDILKESYIFDNKKNMDEWNKNKGTFIKFPWTDISKWLGEEKAQELYKLLIG